MKTLRRVHLYLGCLFAPMLVFFAVSGIWQTLGLRRTDRASFALDFVSSIHTGRRWKIFDGPATLSSPALQGFAVAMAIGLVVTIVLGLVMAFRFGRRRVAFYCLAAGIIVPLALVVVAAQSREP